MTCFSLSMAMLMMRICRWCETTQQGEGAMRQSCLITLGADSESVKKVPEIV